MSYLLINIALYIVTAFIHFYKKKQLDFALVLFILYGAVAVFGAIYYSMTPHMWQISLFPLLYLYLVFMVTTFPLWVNKLRIDKIQVKHHWLFELFLLAMLLSCIICIYYSWTNAMEIVSDDAWGDVYLDDNKQAYVNSIDRLAKNIIGYGRIIASVVIFYNLAYGTKLERRLSIVVLFLLLFASFLIASSRASRSMMLSSIISVLSGFFIFYPLYTKKMIKTFVFGGIMIIVAYFIYSYVIAQARFSVAGSYYDPTESIYSYLGQPMLTFDYGVMDSIHTYMKGDFMFGTNPERYYGGFDGVIGTHFGSGFFTYVGALYIDYGPLGTLLLVCFVAFLMRKKFIVKDLADAFLICYYFSFITNGVFVYGRGYYFPIMMAIITYIILKLIK